MKMMYQIKHTDENFFDRNFLKIIAIFLLLAAFVLVVIFSGPVRSVVSDALSPLLRTGNFFYDTLGKIPKFFSDKSKLMEENESLSAQIENLNLDLVDYDSIKNENNKLRMELGIKPAGNFISASAIAKPPQIPLDTLFLDKGAASGINKGDLVLAADRVLIGKITDVSKNSATAALDSFVGAASYGFVARTNEPLEVKGVGGGSMETKVPIDFDIVVGDEVMTPGSVNYLIAVVGVVEEDTSSGFKNVLMSLPADVSKVNIVFVEPYINE